MRKQRDEAAASNAIRVSIRQAKRLFVIEGMFVHDGDGFGGK
jgi:hypothetical protein